jgi:hypothetical protein
MDQGELLETSDCGIRIVLSQSVEKANLKDPLLAGNGMGA